MGDDKRPDEIIEELGGCGRYQWRISITVHLVKTIFCFSVLTLVVVSATPPWTCSDDVICNNITSLQNVMNASELDSFCPKKSCFHKNSTTSCETFAFEDTSGTVVGEFQLVCSKNYIPSMVMTIEVSGTLLGNLVAGQLGDLVGRKPQFFTSIVIACVFNVVAFFAVNWVMFAVARFFLGLAAGFFLTTQYSLLSEFSLAKWRVWIIGFPSWPVQGCLFVLLAWLIKDWRYIHLMTALLSAVFLFTWCIIPESFRWYIANDKPEKARKIILEVAKYNRKQLHTTTHLTEKLVDAGGKKYTFLDLLKTSSLRRIFFLLSLNWIALGLVHYGISFGVQALSGNVYFNMFLFNIVGIPAKGISLWLQNRFGRRATAVMCHLTVVIGGFAVGVVQTIDAPNKDALTNGFALLAFLGITTNWGPIQTITIETFPTVVRTVGFGSLSIFGRVAAMIGPQLVYADLFVPGILYYVCGVISVISIVACYFLPETKGGNLNDKLSETLGKEKPLANNALV